MRSLLLTLLEFTKLYVVTGYIIDIPYLTGQIKKLDLWVSGPHPWIQSDIHPLILLSIAKNLWFPLGSVT